MAFLDNFRKKEEPILFENRVPLRSRSWTSEDIVTSALKADAKDVMTVKLDQDTGKKLEELGCLQAPDLRLFHFNGCICYLAKDERRVYNLVKMIEEEEGPGTVETQPFPRKSTALESQIQSAKRQNSDMPGYQSRKEFAESNSRNEPPTDTEKRWTEAEATEELEEIEREIKDAERLVASNFSSEKSTEPQEKNENKKGRKTLGRTNRLQFRVTDEELARLQKRVEKSGLTQGEFLRNEVLYGAVNVQEDPFSQPKLMSDLALMRADVGRMGGLLKMAVRPNEGQREFFREDWDALRIAINEIETIKQRLMKLEKSVGECVQNSKGNRPKSEQK